MRRAEDVARCLELGVDFLGFNCWPQSPRYVEPSAIRDASASLGDRAEVMLVFVRAEPDEVQRVVDASGLPTHRVSIQLHGDEDPARYAFLGLGLVPVLRLGGPRGGSVPRLRERARLLVDAYSPAFGGGGRRIDEEALARIRGALPTEWFLAGGLDANNVHEAIVRHAPWGVDVASGVESAPGVKDAAKLNAFVAAVGRASETAGKRDTQPTHETSIRGRGP